jgi:hypothetical protein
LADLIAEEYRLPLVPASAANKSVIFETLVQCGLVSKSDAAKKPERREAQTEPVKR